MSAAPRPPVGLIAIGAFLMVNLGFVTLFGILVTVVELVTGPAGFRIGSFRYGGFIEVEAELRTAYAVPGLPPVDAQPVGLSTPSAVTVVFSEPDRLQHLVYEVPEILLVLIAFSVMLLLLRVVLAALAGEVFVPANRAPAPGDRAAHGGWWRARAGGPVCRYRMVAALGTAG
jgi:hypothetical protein